MLRRASLVFASLILAACGAPTLSSGDETGFVSADGSAVVHEIADRGDVVSISAKSIGTASTWKLADYRGKVVLLNAWGPWCAPCRTELPELQKLYKQFESDGLLIVGLATRTNATSVQAFTSKNSISFPQVEDFDSAVLATIRGIPSATVPGTIFIDRTGRVAGWALGAANPALIRSITESLLEESAA